MSNELRRLQRERNHHEWKLEGLSDDILKLEKERAQHVHALRVVELKLRQHKRGVK